MVTEAMKETKFVLTKPFSLELEGESDSDPAYRAPNLLHRILSLVKNVLPGSDLTHFQLPPLFNFPKSQLQCYGESVYCTGADLLSRCNSGQSPLDRFTSVVAWSISTTRPTSFGVAPYNPILGETHHVSKGNLNVLLEQISHNPPVSALHATDEKENIEMIWCQQPVPKFRGILTFSRIINNSNVHQFIIKRYQCNKIALHLIISQPIKICLGNDVKGTSIEAQVHGKRQLKLLTHGETYEMNCPHLLIRILPVPGVDWVGSVNIRCLESGLVAKLSYRSSPSFLGFGGNRKLIKGQILDSSLMNVLYEVDGHWDRTVKVKDINNGNVRVIYDAKEVISGLQAPIVKDAECVWPTESALVWSELSQAILSKDWEKAREAKQGVEERQRKILREREKKGLSWIPKNFVVSYSKEGGWECSPIHKWVLPAPIITQ